MPTYLVVNDDQASVLMVMIVMLVKTILTTITVGCHLSKEDLELRLQKGLRFKLRESQRLNLVITIKYDDCGDYNLVLIEDDCDCTPCYRFGRMLDYSIVHHPVHYD